MRKTLASLTLATSAMFGSCASNFELESNISDMSASRMTQDDAPFSYQTITLAGTAYEVERATRRLPDEDEMIFRPDMDSTLWRNFAQRKARLISDDILIPTRVYVSKVKEAVGTRPAVEERVPASEVEFNTTGPYALSANIIRKDGKELSINWANEQLERYGIETRSINGRPYAVAIKENRLYLIRTGESDVELGTRRKDGAITLRSPGDIYELKIVSQKEYDARKNYMRLPSSDGPVPIPSAAEIK